MINEKKLVEDMEEWYESIEDSMNGDFAKSIIKVAIGKIKSQPKVNEWIPVSHRSPETFEDTKSSDVVLVCGYDKESDYHWQAMGFYVNTEAIKRWFFAECKNTDKPIDWIDIVAWMPLPEPYKGD